MEEWKALFAARCGITRGDTELPTAGPGTNDQCNDHRLRSCVQEITTAWINKIRLAYNGRVIRRTVESWRYDGKTIDDSWPPYKMVTVPVYLSAEEYKTIDDDMLVMGGR
jgi:hypothetical protein